MKKLKSRILEFTGDIGIAAPEQKSPKNDYNYADYQLSTDLEKTIHHLNFLKNIEDQEEKRLESIDNKTSNLIAQTAVVFSLVGLFMPFLMEKMTDLNILIRIISVLFLVVTCFLYILAIINAIKNYHISNFNYIKPSAKNVIEFKDKETQNFVAEEVRDLLYAIPINRFNNDIKGTNLLHSYNAFKLANLLTGILIATFCFSMLFLQKEENTIKIEDSVRIHNSKRFGSYVKCGNK
ncbi:hypothetical protein [Sphingobacterium sp. SGL-16]|uniref:hypothetical protein n=1 Tax=Sphingobacterium sp. SGL-16 TaxID=2710883 RepID=UPI0013E9A542|nr:hypothetical protein [Sphingobacterium sp. SGL-16]NGM72759.1 hypothetical protein [Sphingobacterium sp. SGL-16]